MHSHITTVTIIDMHKIIFTQLCINGKLVTLIQEGGVNRCEVYRRQGW
jgi:hypothetical protein